MDRAKEHDADFIVFPELSLTGYEPTLAASLAANSDCDFLTPLVELAQQYQMTIVVGCPIVSVQAKPHIGFVLHPNGRVDIYRKRFLHPGEEEHFASSKDTIVCACKNERVGIAICADINNPLHVQYAGDCNATIYAAGVAMTPRGISEAETNMSTYAKQHQMATIMSNYGSDTGGFEMAGRSGIWNEHGEMVVQAPDAGEFVVLATRSMDGWVGKLLSA